ncbi:MAG: hypothetical protein AAB229_10455 [Candidatus Hydrogenedentota bacterium]
MTLFRMALREASRLHPGSALLVLFLAPFAVIPYAALLAVESSSRVASDIAYLFALLAAHAIAIQYGAGVRPLENGFTDLLRVRGLSAGAILRSRAAGFGTLCLLPLAAVVGGSVLAAGWMGARDILRVAIAQLGALQTFGVAVFFGAILSRQATAICAYAVVLIGQVPSGRDNIPWIFPRYAVFDFWPGDVPGPGETASLILGALAYGVGGVLAASALAEIRDR